MVVSLIRGSNYHSALSTPHVAPSQQETLPSHCCNLYCIPQYCITIYPLNALYLHHIKSAHRVHYYNGTHFVFNREPYRKMPNMFASPTKIAQLINDDETDVSSVDFKNVLL